MGKDYKALVAQLRIEDLAGMRQHEREARIVLSALLREAADAIETLTRERDEATARAERAEAALNEAVIKVENDRTMRNEEWLIWLYDARAALAQKDAAND